MAFPLSVQRCHLLVDNVIASHLQVNIKSKIYDRFFVINQQKGNMPLRSKYVPVFGSQSSDSQNGLSQSEKMTVPGPTAEQANVGLLKVKLPKFHKGERKNGQILQETDN